MAPRLAARTFIATIIPVKAAIALAKRDCVSRAGNGYGIHEVCVHAGESRNMAAPHAICEMATMFAIKTIAMTPTAKGRSRTFLPGSTVCYGFRHIKEDGQI